MKKETVHTMQQLEEYLLQLQPDIWVTVVQFEERIFIWHGVVSSPHEYIYCGIAGNYKEEVTA